MAKRERPSIEDMEGGIQHSYDHRGSTGKYGTIYKSDAEVEGWRPSEAEHEFCMIPFLCTKNSVFRTKNPDFNKPFDDEVIQNESSWAHKLTVLVHNNIGANKDAVLCLRTLKEECPICEERDSIFALIDQETDKDAAKLLQDRADKLGTAKRALYNVLVFDSEKEMGKGVQLWDAPHASIEDVLSELYTNKRTGEKKYYTIPEQGWNVCFEKKGKGLNTEYRKVSIEKRRSEDVLNEKDLGELYGMAYNLDEVVDIKDYQTLRTMLYGVAEEEEKPTQTSRFRGREEKKEATKEEPKEEEPKEDPKEIQKPEDLPKEYVECFGVLNNQRTECEDCPKRIWTACVELTEENKKATKQEPTRKFRRDLG